jgi:putative phosphoesterase
LRIGIISDTHIRKNMDRIEDFLNSHLGNVDMIIHAGDYVSSRVVSLLEQHKGFVGVWGNVDGENVREKLREKEIVRVLGHRIGIYHGHGEKKTTLERSYEKFKDDNVDIIVYGHSHQPAITTKGGILMLNPGSLSSRRREKWFSYILLELDRDRMNISLQLF